MNMQQMILFPKRLLFSLAMLCCMATAFGQKHFDGEAFEQQLVSYVTQQAKLSADEAHRFQPIYKEMVTKKRALHDQLRALRHQKPTTDKAARSLIVRADDLEIRMKQVEKDYHQRMLKVVSPLKLKKVLEAERKYHRMMLRKAAKKGK